MAKGLLLLWLLIGIEQLYLTSAASEMVWTAVLGRSVTLPCLHLSWSQSRNSMCWGRGPCPNSKCNQEILHTDGTKVISGKSAKYRLQGNIQRGDVSLTIFNTHEGDSGVYCCRIEVPGWFNDVKKNIRLELRRAPTTTRRTTTTTTCQTTTTHPTTTPRMTTTTTVLPTTAMSIPDFATETMLQTTTTSVLPATATTPPPTALSSFPEEYTEFLITEPSTEELILTAESETFLVSSESWQGTEATSADTDLLTSEVSEILGHDGGLGQVKMIDHTYLMMIIAPCLGFMLLALLAVFLLRGKVTKTNCLQEHTRIGHVGETNNVLRDMQNAREDEDVLFTL
uniref:T cell immunoglobulin and mucin domain containing 4 n=1 Tax=Oryctolagus cuniculus TaxID=9986 RepID=A0A5F9DDH1_RABIT